MEYVHVKPTPQKRHKDADGKPLARMFRSPVFPHRPIPEYGERLPKTVEVYRGLKSREIEKTTAEAVAKGREEALKKAGRITSKEPAQPADTADTDAADAADAADAGDESADTSAAATSKKPKGGNSR